jgi:hypothetical protein
VSSVAEYIGGLLLCLLVSFVYCLARKDRAGAVLKETVLVFVYTLGAIAAVTLIALLACKFK